MIYIILIAWLLPTVVGNIMIWVEEDEEDTTLGVYLKMLCLSLIPIINISFLLFLIAESKAIVTISNIVIKKKKYDRDGE